MDDYQRQDLLALRRAPGYRSYLGDLCEPYVRGRVVLEVGAGLGDLGLELAARGAESVTLLEPGSECFQELAREVSPPVRALKSFSQELLADEPATFDTVIYSNVLEHIEDDLLELRTGRDLLRAGGCLLVIAPAHGWLMSPIDRMLRHYRRYTIRSFEALVREAGGLEILECRYVNKLGVAGWLVNKLRGATHQSELLFGIFDRWVLPVSRLLDPIAPRTFGLSIVAAVRRI